MDNALPLQQGIQIRGVIRVVPRTIDGAVVHSATAMLVHLQVPALVETATRVPRRL